jgi:hypothetical protein
VKIRFQADENLDQNIISGVLRREPSLDFLAPQYAGLLGVDDLAVLRRCASEGRVLVTCDVSTMPDHFASFVGQQPSAGVLLVPSGTRVGEVIESLVLIWNCSDAEEWINRICFLPL